MSGVKSGAVYHRNTTYHFALLHFDVKKKKKKELYLADVFF